MKQGLQLRIGQSLTMTPQLQQAIKLLQLSSLELQNEIQLTLDSNPLLEQDEQESVDKESDAENKQELSQESIPDNDNKSAAESLVEDRAEQTLPDELVLDTDWDKIYDNAPMYTASSLKQSDNNDFFENQSIVTDGLFEHLTWQLNSAHLSETDYQIGQAIIDAVDDRGYLTETIEDILSGLQQDEPELELDDVEAVLNLVQHFDPLGVAARSPADCMLIQLRQMDSSTPHLRKAIDLVDKYLDYLASNDFAVLKRRLQANDAELAQIVALIQSTNPYPGALVSQNHAQYIAPDVYVSKSSGKWLVRINPENAPRLRVNDQYAGLVKRGDNSKQNNYLRDNLQEARWFIKSLQSRNETLLRVAKEIVDRQSAFLSYGEEAMQPLILRDIAEALEMHESTISRVTTQKYMHTPRGVLEFKYFFSSHVSTADGGACSATAIRALIKKLIAAEPVKKPLSDNKIASLLDEQGIRVARRTIAKYREKLLIPPSNERKRLF